MGQLFENFEPYDVQATRAEARALGVEECREDYRHLYISSIMSSLKNALRL